MIKKPVMIQIRNGLEARPVALLVQVASQYDSEIYVESCLLYTSPSPRD